MLTMEQFPFEQTRKGASSKKVMALELNPTTTEAEPGTFEEFVECFPAPPPASNTAFGP